MKRQTCAAPRDACGVRARAHADARVCVTAAWRVLHTCKLWNMHARRTRHGCHTYVWAWTYDARARASRWYVCAVCVGARARARAFCATLRYLRRPTRSASPRRLPRPRRWESRSRRVGASSPCVPASRSRTRLDPGGGAESPGGERPAPAANRLLLGRARREQVEGASSGPRAQPIFFYSMEGPCNLCCEYRLGGSWEPPTGPPGTRQQVSRS